MNRTNPSTPFPSPYENMSLFDVPGIEDQNTVENLKKEGICTPKALMKKYLELYDPGASYPPGRFCAWIIFYLTPPGFTVNDDITRQRMDRLVAWAEAERVKMIFPARKF